MLQHLMEILPSWEQVLQPLSDHFVEIIVAVAIFEAFLSLIIYMYNNYYRRKISRWFRNDILKECSMPSSTIGRWLQTEHLLHTFRVEYVQKLDDKNAKQLREEYHKLTNEKSHTVYAYSKGVRTFFNLFYDLIPMFPMLGILGTVVAIACQFSTTTGVTNESEVILRSVTQNFGTAIWTTVFGIGFSIIFTVINALFVESGTQKCFELEKMAQTSLDEVLHLIASRERSFLQHRNDPAEDIGEMQPELESPTHAEKQRKKKRRQNGGPT